MKSWVVRQLLATKIQQSANSGFRGTAVDAIDEIVSFDISVGHDAINT